MVDQITDAPDAGHVEPTAAVPVLVKSTWADLALYLVGGFGLFVLASVGTSVLFSIWFKQVNTLLAATAYLLNIIFIGGSVYVLGVRRRKVSWADMGFWPAVWQWRWLPLAAGISVVFIPVRGALGLLVQFLLQGGLESMQGRLDVLTAGGAFSWLNFLVTLLGAGVLAPISEELYFRGLIHRWFQGRLGFWPRVVLSSFIFGLAHFDSLGVVASSWVLGMVNAVAFEKSKSLWLPIAIHMITNSIAVLLLYVTMWAGQFVK